MKGHFASICAKSINRDVIFDLPSEAERKGFSFAMHAILANERIKNIGFVPIYDMENAIKRTIEILK